MTTHRMRSQFDAALRGANPHEALYALAKSLKYSGVGQVELYHLYSEYLQKIDGRDPRYDAVADTMDLIWGGLRAKSSALFDRELTDADVQGPPP